ncbi:hypothetical protein [Bartonella rattaustraliani]|uniref:Membrane protein n=1 Tax=Bartonella rattaustraliani TaxID=481139 RepID=D3TZD1_9HYPH|nr:hypothetical protein [Bartonella rattaustraliani]ACN38885.1 membrane protein [Bartonella rattaustraliani]
MDILSTHKLKTEEKNSISRQPILITVMRIVMRVVRKILKICVFFLFLFLLFIRRPIIILTQFMVGGSFLVLFMLWYGYMLGAKPYEHQTAMVIGYIIFVFLGLAANWGYDALLLRLAPPEYELILFQ